MIFAPPPGHVPGPTEQDLKDNWVVAPAVVEEATELAKTYAGPHPGHVYAVVAMALPGKTHGIWTIGQKVVTLPGAWLAWGGGGEPPAGLPGLHETTAKAEELAAAWLTAHGLAGITGYGTVDADGYAAVWEGFHEIGAEG